MGVPQVLSTSILCNNESASKLHTITSFMSVQNILILTTTSNIIFAIASCLLGLCFLQISLLVFLPHLLPLARLHDLIYKLKMSSSWRNCVWGGILILFYLSSLVFSSQFVIIFIFLGYYNLLFFLSWLLSLSSWLILSPWFVIIIIKIIVHIKTLSLLGTYTIN